MPHTQARSRQPARYLHIRAITWTRTRQARKIELQTLRARSQRQRASRGIERLGSEWDVIRVDGDVFSCCYLYHNLEVVRRAELITHNYNIRLDSWMHSLRAPGVENSWGWKQYEYRRLDVDPSQSSSQPFASIKIPIQIRQTAKPQCKR